MLYTVEFWNDEVEEMIKRSYAYRHTAEEVVAYLESRGISYTKSF